MLARSKLRWTIRAAFAALLVSAACGARADQTTLECFPDPVRNYSDAEKMPYISHLTVDTTAMTVTWVMQGGARPTVYPITALTTGEVDWNIPAAGAFAGAEDSLNRMTGAIYEHNHGGLPDDMVDCHLPGSQKIF